jgi:glyoxylase-like metal-dependent hydrolase (beta-lactamase superfamily II)
MDIAAVRQAMATRRALPRAAKPVESETMKTHGDLRLEGFTEPSFQENGYLLWAEGCADAWILDPSFAPQPEMIAAAVEKHGLTPVAIVLTHGHVDHIAGVPAIREKYPGIPIIGSAGEQHMLVDAQENLSAQLGMALEVPEADQPLQPGDTLTLGSLTWQVLDVSGHTVGGLAFHCAEAGVVMTGDALFAGSVGRTDFPGGSSARLLENIAAHLLSLPDETAVYSGHGPPTTIGRERQHNICLQGEV